MITCCNTSYLHISIIYPTTLSILTLDTWMTAFLHDTSHCITDLCPSSVHVSPVISPILTSKGMYIRSLLVNFIIFPSGRSTLRDVLTDQYEAETQN